ncbi:MAG: hypothetical protein QOG18_429 [Microbacteriaceae bacterium]|nr:hypothetical protein [Microbacteriaceae bacterium]
MDTRTVPTSIRGPLGRARRYTYRRRNAFARALHERGGAGPLVPDPVFVLCPVRSGSTLLRAILNKHPQISSPHELHLNTMRVSTAKPYARNSWASLQLTPEDLENMLWDRALHWNLVRDGKRIIVDKTPQNAAIWPRIHEYWPEARYVHLRRHPASIVASLVRAKPNDPPEEQVRRVLLYGSQLDSAREALSGPTVRYEDLTRDPEGTIKQICRYLGVRWQPRMLNYDRTGHHAGLGDWSAKIRSGRIQPPDPLPDPSEIPAALLPLVRSWNYLD